MTYTHSLKPICEANKYLKHYYKDKVETKQQILKLKRPHKMNPYFLIFYIVINKNEREKN